MVQFNDKVDAKGWRSWALLGSLALNLLILGIVVGFMFRGPKFSGPKEGANDIVRSMIAAMPQSQRSELRKTIGSRKEAHSVNRKRVRGISNEVVKLLEAETLDIEAFEELLTQQRSVISEITRSGHSVVISTVSTMTQQERAEYAANLRDLSQRRRRR